MKLLGYLRPTEHRRLNEGVGLILVTVAVLVALSLISFNASDPSFNISRNADFADRPENLVGVVGSYVSDLVFQAFGFAGFLIPIFLGVYAFHWLASWNVANVGPRLAGMALMLLALSAALALLPVPRIDAEIPAGGGTGTLVARWLAETFNPTGTVVLLASSLLVSLLFTTTFSLERTAAAIGPRLGFVAAWRERVFTSWSEWRKQQTRRRIEKKHARMETRHAAVPETRVEPPVEQRKAESPRRVPAPARKKSAESRGLFGNDPGVEAVSPTERTPPRQPPSTFREVDFPPTDLLHPSESEIEFDEDELRDRAKLLAAKAGEFDVIGQIQEIHPGPVVTTFEFKPEPGIKYSRIISLADDLCLALEAESIRIDRMPGKSTVGMEIPNPDRATIALRELLESEEYLHTSAALPLALGKDITGRIVISDLARMPHLLIAGSTGTGKSVSLNCLILSLLYRSQPDQVKLIMIDPKRLELGLYQDIPHLMVPVVTEPIQATNALKWAVSEMESRYKKLARQGVRTLEAYNQHVRRIDPENPPRTASMNEGDEAPTELPYIVIIIDELADLMMVASKDVETCITRLAQMARAVGIHLILATQRPSVDVITGLIKANFPARISFRVASKIDSRTILDSNGAESLLGRGDMLFLPPGSSRLMRVHGPMVSEKEVARVAEYLKSQGDPTYDESIIESPEERRALEASGPADELYDAAARLVVAMGKASTSALQRRLRIGYGRAASLLDQMEADGIVGPPEGSKPREVLVKPDFFSEFDNRDPEEPVN